MTRPRVKLQSTTAATPGQTVTFSLSNYEDYPKHELSFKPSASVATGTLEISVSAPGNSEYFHLGTLDLSDTGDYLLQYTGCIDSLKAVPASFPAAKTYSLYLSSRIQ